MVLAKEEKNINIFKFHFIKNKGFLGGAVVKNLHASAEDAGDTGLIPGLRRSSEEENDNPLQYSCLENSMGRGAWRATAHGDAESWT